MSALVQALAAFAERQPWMAQAACRGVDASLFFPDAGGSGGIEVEKAKGMCRGCPVRKECLEYGLNEPFGIWGGASERERRRMRQGRELPNRRCAWAKCRAWFTPTKSFQLYCQPEHASAEARAAYKSRKVG